MNRGTIFDIQRFSLHDGPGIRTTVFLKGCPLRCRWCHNPEGMTARPVLSFQVERCVLCGACAAGCARGAHRVADGRHDLDRGRCMGCGDCVLACCAGALERVGRDVSVEEILAVVMRDEPFYRNSGGGMTLSGGEPMAQPAFTRELLREAKAGGLHVALETCGYAAFDLFAAVLPDVDLFLYDLKDTDPARHMENTGVALAPILDNLRRLDAAGARLWLRCPIIAGMNADETHLAALAALAATLRNAERISLLPYHPLGQSKYRRLGISDPMSGWPEAAADDVECWRAFTAARTTLPVDVA